MRRTPVWTVVVALACLVAACTSGSSGSPGKGAPARSLVSAVPAGLPGVGTLPGPASAWPEAGHDARLSSAIGTVGPQRGHVRWRARLGGAVTPGPVIAVDGSVLAATNGGVLYDVDPATGRTRWRFDGHASYGSDLSTSPAVLSTGTILWPGPNDTLYALAPDGRRLWQHRFTAQVLSPAVAGADRVYVADLGGRLAALDVSAAVPRLVWQLSVGGPDYAGPSVGPDGTIYTAHDHELVAVRDLGSRAAIRWRLRTARLVEVSNAVAPNGDVVLGTNGDREYGVRPDGTLDWALDIGDYTYSSSTAAPNGLAYFGDNTGRVHVVDTRTGRERHRIVTPADGNENVWTSVAVDVRGDFYWATTKAHVYAYRPDGTQLFRLSVDGGVNSYPALDASGALYLGTTNGTLYAVE